MNIVFTVCNRIQLKHALCLGDSVHKHYPDSHFVLGWVDSIPLTSLPEWVHVIPIESLALDSWTEMKSQYYDFELVEACKPFFARDILIRYPQCNELIYFSPSTLVLESFETILIDTASVQLTPNILNPIDSDSNLKDKNILNIGMYHGGSWILHTYSNEIPKLLDWWCDRTRNRAHFDLCEGMCLDQLWVNFIPIYNEGVSIIRNIGWHYGLSRITGTKLTKSEGKYHVDGKSLMTIDFAGLESFHPVWSNHTDLVNGHPVWKELRANYRELLEKKPEIKDENVEPVYGKPSHIKSNRNLRLKGIKLLNDLIFRIDTFNWTYN